jgi:hypothetical protein
VSRGRAGGGHDETRNTSQDIKSIVGGVLAGLGLHILSGNVAGDVARLKLALGMPAGEVLGVLPSVALVASRTAQAYALDQHRLFGDLLQMLATFWPLLLVIVGTILLRDALADKVNELPAPGRYFQNKYFQKKDTGCRFRCPSFDA